MDLGLIFGTENENDARWGTYGFCDPRNESDEKLI
jgi:hypothetical protein